MPKLTLEHWDAQGSHPVDDPGRAREMARRLVETWRRFMPDELTPDEEAREWATVPGTSPRGAGTG